MLFPVGVANAGDTQNSPADDKAPVINVSSLPTDLDGQIQRAQILRADGKLDEASRALGQMMLVAPDDARVVAEYGKVLVMENQAADAEAFLKRAIELQNGDWTYYSALGVAFDEQGNSKGAKLAYERALMLKPGEPAILNNYALSRKAAGDLISARQIIAEAAAAGAGDPTIARNVALLADNPKVRVATVAPVAPSAKVTNAVTVAAAPPIQLSPNSDAPADGDASHQASSKSVVAVAEIAPTEPTGAVATHAPRVLSNNVMMQRVPVDPLAGPIGKVAHARTKLGASKLTARPASVSTSAAVAAKKPKTPSLRMSADAS